MAINVEISKNNNENNTGVLRRFSKRVQGSGILNRMRGLRHYKRPPSQFARKKQALKSIKRRKEVKRQIKLGKLPDRLTNKSGKGK